MHSKIALKSRLRWKYHPWNSCKGCRFSLQSERHGAHYQNWLIIWTHENSRKRPKLERFLKTVVSGRKKVVLLKKIKSSVDEYTKRTTARVWCKQMTPKHAVKITRVKGEAKTVSLNECVKVKWECREFVRCWDGTQTDQLSIWNGRKVVRAVTFINSPLVWYWQYSTSTYAINFPQKDS